MYNDVKGVSKWNKNVCDFLYECLLFCRMWCVRVCARLGGLACYILLPIVQVLTVLWIILTCHDYLYSLSIGIHCMCAVDV